MVPDYERGFEFSQTLVIRRRKQQEENVLFGASKSRRILERSFLPWLVQAPSVFWRGHPRASWRQPQKVLVTQPSLNQALRKVPTVPGVFPNCLWKETLEQMRGTHDESTHSPSLSFTGTLTVSLGPEGSQSEVPGSPGRPFWRSAKSKQFS